MLRAAAVVLVPRSAALESTVGASIVSDIRVPYSGLATVLFTAKIPQMRKTRRPQKSESLDSSRL